jgi:hypothetical protein
MDSTNNNISQSLLQSSDSMMPSTSYSSNGNTGFFESLKNINMTTWLIIILILAFLGFNIFAYLAKGTEDVTNVFKPLLDKIFGSVVEVTSQATDVAAEGAKAVVGGTASTLQTGLTAVQNVTPNAAPTSIKSQPISQESTPTESTLNRALNTAQSQQQDYQANEAPTSVHSASGKAGWCYVGMDRGFRTCAEVGVNDTCMSGEIFPSHEICMNPNLRT